MTLRAIPKNLNRVIHGEKYGYFRPTGEFRKPKHGDFFISGAVPTAYVAFQDLDTECWIAEEVELRECPYCGGLGKVPKED